MRSVNIRNGRSVFFGASTKGTSIAMPRHCHDDTEAPEFESESRKSVFTKGMGLPGRVWESGNPSWIDDVVEDKNFLRAKAAVADGIHSAFGFPIKLDEKVLGVFEFFSNEIQAADSELLELMTAIGSQMGQFIKRKRVENLLRESESRFRQLADAMPQIVWAARPDGLIDYYNERWYELPGFCTVIGSTELGADLAP